jgi:hypothetical protein
VYVNKGGPGSLLLNSTVRYLRAGPRACLRAPLRCTSSRSSQRSAAGRMRPRLALASRRTPLRSSQTSGLQSEMFPEFKFMQSDMVQELNAKRRSCARRTSHPRDEQRRPGCRELRHTPPVQQGEKSLKACRNIISIVLLFELFLVLCLSRACLGKLPGSLV